METTFCYGCMKEKKSSPICEYCGYDERTTNAPNQLPMGTVLQGKYRIGRVLGQGGFGITYLGQDMTLAIPVAIKEYYPQGMVSRDATHCHSVTVVTGGEAQFFQENRERFLREARTLARLEDVPEVVQVKNFFLENNTAYIVMGYIQGITLKEYIQKNGRLTPDAAFAMLRPLMYAMSVVHSEGLVHRDISPDNIMVTPAGRVKLIDFGAVHAATAQGDKSTMAMLKHGFAPPEQYQRKGKLGPWTDVYAICATLYNVITGLTPPTATDRFMGAEDFEWDAMAGLTERQRDAMAHGLGLQHHTRIQTMEALCRQLFEEDSAISASQNAVMSTGDVGTIALEETLPPVGHTDPVEPAVYTAPVDPAIYTAPVEQQIYTVPVDRSAYPAPGEEIAPAPVEEPDPTPIVSEKPAESQEATENRDRKNHVPEEEKPKAQKKKTRMAVAAVIAALFVVYLCCYSAAKSNARKGNYDTAEGLLFVRSVTMLHDDKLATYIDAGKLMDAQQYEEAYALFQKISGYMDAADMAKEAHYCLSLQRAAADEYIGALALMEPLSKEGYKDSAQKVLEIKYQQAVYLMNRKEYIEAYKKFEAIRNYSDASIRMDDLKERIYAEGQDLYHKKKYTEAKEMFTFLGSYQDSKKYLTLISAHQGELRSDPEGMAKKLVEIFYFEDASQLLVSDTYIAIHFFLGNWKTANSGYYFKMKEEKDGGYWCSYNLPWFSGDTFYIENGVYYISRGSSERKSQFRFTLLSPDSMEVYCYKNSKTYILDRK